MTAFSMISSPILTMLMLLLLAAAAAFRILWAVTGFGLAPELLLLLPELAAASPRVSVLALRALSDVNPMIVVVVVAVMVWIPD